MTPSVSEFTETDVVQDDRLLPHHLEHLRGSGLANATIEAAKIFSLTADDSRVAGQALHWNGPGPVPAIAIPNLDRDGEVTHWLLRPDVPVARQDGSRPKYESPVGMPTRLYFPPKSLVDAISWTDLTVTLLLVEGIKKALAAAQAGAAAISAQGTFVWHDIEHREATDEWRLHPDFDGVPLRDRVVCVAFDGGDTTVNPAVIDAEARLVRMLLDVGADARVLRIPTPDGSSKVGLDDFLANRTDPRVALNHLVDRALIANPIKRAQMAIAGVRR